MTDTIPTAYQITYCGCTVRVSRREWERIQSYVAQQQRLAQNAKEYMDWLVSYRGKHPHKPRKPATPPADHEGDTP